MEKIVYRTTEIQAPREAARTAVLHALENLLKAVSSTTDSELVHLDAKGDILSILIQELAGITFADIAEIVTEEVLCECMQGFDFTLKNTLVEFLNSLAVWSSNGKPASIVFSRYAEHPMLKQDGVSTELRPDQFARGPLVAGFEQPEVLLPSSVFQAIHALRAATAEYKKLAAGPRIRHVASENNHTSAAPDHEPKTFEKSWQAALNFLATITSTTLSPQLNKTMNHHTVTINKPEVPAFSIRFILNELTWMQFLKETQYEAHDEMLASVDLTALHPREKEVVLQQVYRYAPELWKLAEGSFLVSTQKITHLLIARTNDKTINVSLQKW